MGRWGGRAGGGGGEGGGGRGAPAGRGRTPVLLAVVPGGVLQPLGLLDAAREHLEVVPRRADRRQRRLRVLRHPGARAPARPAPPPSSGPLRALPPPGRDLGPPRAPRARRPRPQANPSGPGGPPRPRALREGPPPPSGICLGAPPPRPRKPTARSPPGSPRAPRPGQRLGPSSRGEGPRSRPLCCDLTLFSGRERWVTHRGSPGGGRPRGGGGAPGSSPPLPPGGRRTCRVRLGSGSWGPRRFSS